VLDNEHFGETGRQPRLTGMRTDLCAIARGVGIEHTLEVTAMDQIDALAELMFGIPGPTFAVAKIALTEHPWALPEKDGAVIARRFMNAATE